MFKLLFVLGLLTASQARPNHFENKDQEWNEFKLKYGKNYPENGVEEIRKEIYFQNKAEVEKHNSDYESNSSSWLASLNKYSDLTFEELNSVMNGLKPELKRPSNEVFVASEGFEAPENLDYRKSGYVTDVKDQGTCGSCWSFSATGSLEGQLFRINKTLISLSEQNLIDCSKEYRNNGCHGGLMNQAFEYIKDNHGIDTEDSYPYEGVDDKKCRYDEKNKAGEDSGYVDIESESDDALLEALVQKGPISVAVFADTKFKHYGSGVFESKGCLGMGLNHGVLLIGHGVDAKTGKKYWLIKNSWGLSWGEKGFMKLSREIKNNCGVSTMASYPKV